MIGRSGWALLCVLFSAVAAVAQEAPALPPADSEAGLNAMIVIGEPQGTPLAGAELERMTEEVASLMRCPVCQGLSVADSPTDTALAMKREVRDLLAAGFTGDQVIRYFEKSYGEFIRLEPKPEGFNLLVWVAPVAGLLLGLAVIAVRLRGGGRREPQADAAAAEAPAEDEDPELAAYRERVRREIAGNPAAASAGEDAA